MSAEDAARDIALGPFADWLDAERIVINVSTLYGEFAGSVEPANPIALFGQMAAWRRR